MALFTKDKPENETNKTPLQDEKQDIINEIIEEKIGGEPEVKAGVKSGDKRGSYNKGKKKKPIRKKPVVAKIEPVYTEIQATNDANFITALIDEFRTGSGLPKMKDSHKSFLTPSAKAMFLKYGSSTSKWMPEIMFTGSLIFIGLDTVKEMRILKEKSDKKPEIKKPDLKGFEKIKSSEGLIKNKPVDKIKPTKTL